jgi:hypothetical protein
MKKVTLDGDQVLGTFHELVFPPDLSGTEVFLVDYTINGGAGRLANAAGAAAATGIASFIMVALRYRAVAAFRQ